MSTVTLSAVYSCPTDTHTFTVTTETETPVATEASSQKEQTAHVGALRENVGKLQDAVNAYLTERMEVEKRELSAAEEGVVEGAEETYGEEEAGEEEEEV